MTRPDATRWRTPQRLPAHAPPNAGRGLRARARQLSAQWALAWLLLALVMAPTLGRLHQVVHGGALDRVHAGQPLPATSLSGWAQPGHSAPPLHAATAGGAPAQEAAGAAIGAHGHGPLLSLLLAHHAPADCLLLDQLVLGAALASASLVLPPALPAALQPLPPAEPPTAALPAPYQARAPPAA